MLNKRSTPLSCIKSFLRSVLAGRVEASNEKRGWSGFFEAKHFLSLNHSWKIQGLHIHRQKNSTVSMKTGFSNYGLNFTHTTDITQHQQRAGPHLEETATIRNIITIMMITFMANTSTNVLPNLTKPPQAFCLHVQLVLLLLSPSSPAITLPSIMDRSTISFFFQIFHFGFCMFLNVSWHVTALEFVKSFTPE